MIKYEECKQILNDSKGVYTGEEIKAIRKFLYHLAQIAIEEFKKIEDEKERYHICTSVNR